MSELFEVDADLFRAMAVNLVRNAMQACCKGDEILVSTLRQGSELIVRVTDTGPGMDAKTRDAAFVPYFSTKKNGTGLGLSIVRRIVQAHGGSIHLSSEPGKGTQFTLLLPESTDDRRRYCQGCYCERLYCERLLCERRA